MSALLYQRNFSLDRQFLRQYEDVEPSFGFNGLGKFVFYEKYSNVKDDGTKEQFWEAVARVTEGTYSIQKNHILLNNLPWNEAKAQESAQEFYTRMFDMKFLPPGRGLQVMGGKLLTVKGLAAALNNCAYTSTDFEPRDPSKPFRFMMDMSMLGVGVGFGTEGAGTLPIYRPSGSLSTFVVPDSREGWVESLDVLLRSYFERDQQPVEFDYSQVRPKGTLIKGWGMRASGPEPLIEMHDVVSEVLDSYTGGKLDARGITDIFNLEGRAVVSGNVRRSAQIALGRWSDKDFVNLKNVTLPENHRRMGLINGEYTDKGWGWASNNTIRAELGMDYTEAAASIAVNGEPGFFWVDNVQNYARMGDAKPDRATGVNPCAEQALEPYELCTLTELFPAKADSSEDFHRTIKFAYLYAKTVTLARTHWPETNRVMLRNRRIGLSVTGLAQYLSHHDLFDLRALLRAGYSTVQRYDEVYSDWLCVPRSIRTTTVKPSGTISLVAGATSGMHFPEDRYYIKRVQVPDDSPLLQAAIEAGYRAEPAVQYPGVHWVEFPVDVGAGVRLARDVSMWEQLHLAATLQQDWSDNSVSCTVTFAKHEAKDIANALNYFQFRLKTISFLPRFEGGAAYPQMPIEAISAERYAQMVASIKGAIKLTVGSEASGDRYCTTDTCEMPRPKVVA